MIIMDLLVGIRLFDRFACDLQGLEVLFSNHLERHQGETIQNGIQKRLSWPSFITYKVLYQPKASLNRVKTFINYLFF